MEHEALKEHGKQLKSLAALLHGDASRQFGAGQWSKVYADIRVPSGGRTASSIRMAIVAGEGKRLETSNEVGSLILDLVKARTALPGAPWFGCKIVVTADGECDVKYDYDESCIERLVDDNF